MVAKMNDVSACQPDHFLMTKKAIASFLARDEGGPVVFAFVGTNEENIITEVLGGGKGLSLNVLYRTLGGLKVVEAKLVQVIGEVERELMEEQLVAADAKERKTLN